MKAVKNDLSQFAMLIKKTRMEMSVTDFLRFHLMLIITSLMMNIHAINNSVSLTLGMIAMEIWIG
jgi:hypothetical protein